MALSLAATMSPALADSSDGQKNGIVYSSVINPLPGNLPSVGFESTAFNEFGNAVNFSSGSSHDLTKVVTLNIYSPSTDGVNPGAKIASFRTSPST